MIETAERSEPARRAWDLAVVLPIAAAAFSAGAAGIHGSVITEHAREYWLFALFFALSAGLQLVWSYLVLTKPSRSLLIVGAVGNLLTVLLWVASRTVGLPFGPEAGSPEAVGFADVVCTVLEVGVVVCAGVLLWPAAMRRLRGRAAPYLGVVAAMVASAVAVAVAMGAGAEPGEATRTTAASGTALLSAHGLHLLVVVAVVGGFAGWRTLERLARGHA